MEHFKLYIDGQFVDAQDGAAFETLDPGTGQAFATVAQAGPAEAEAAIQAARRAFDSGVWSGMAPDKRARIMMDFADRVLRQAVRLAMFESLDSGGIINRTKTEVFLGSLMVRNLAQLAARDFPWREEIPVSGNPFFPARNYIRREPIGVCVGIIPWNFPFSMAMWKIAMAAIMGNTVVLKPASHTPVSALIIAEALAESQVPPGVVNIIAGPGQTLGQVLCTHPMVDKIAFTGSTQVGREIMKMAADTVKKVTLELGGKSANIVLDDADLNLAIDGGLFGTFFHCGQVCESGTRILVQDKLYDQFVERLAKRVGDIHIAYQLDAASQMGPLVSAGQLATTEQYVQLGRQEGAELVCGGKRPERFDLEDGYYYQPTIFAGVNNSMRVAREEIFGPVVCVIPFHDDEEAVAIANDSPYGLAGGVWSQDIARAEAIAHGVATGTMWINDYHAFGDYCPFGGYKQSGVGRELGYHGLAEYTQIKRVHVAAEADPANKLAFQMMFSYPHSATFQYAGPTKLNSGQGSIASIGAEMQALGCQRAILLSDPGVAAAGLVEKAKKALGGYCAGVFLDIPQDSSLATVDAAAAVARQVGADAVVSVGGGSVMDTAKALAVLLSEGGQAIDHVAVLRLNRPATPHIAVPTTAGTGSEVTNVAVIKNHQVGRKVYVLENALFPRVAILDPQFVRGLPPGLTAGTGLDALTHALEALMSLRSNPVCDGLALHALRLIAQNLPVCVENGQDLAARSHMQVAAALAGWAFCTAQVALAHAMAHTVGALYGVPHGSACGVVLPHVMRFNAESCAPALALAAQALGVETAGMDQAQAALAAATAVDDLMERVGHPRRLRDLGVPEEALFEAAAHAVADPACIFNPRPVTDPGQVYEVFEQAW
ncbi:MAG: aldehyde dehydrogenase family protein [Desulfarculus sp.]|nr:aldehyde dehydrogenase family protein [Desulfarculus sp.]